MGCFNTTPMRHLTPARAGAPAGLPDAELREHLPEMRSALHDEARCRRSALAELDALIDRAGSAADALDDRGRLRRAVRPRPRHLAAPVRARARRLARPRPGHDRPGADLREGRPVPGAGRTARLPAGGAGVRLDPAAARGARLPGRDGAHPQRHLQRAAAARQRLRQRAWRAARTGRREGAGRSKSPPDEPLDESWDEPVVFDGCSSKGQASPGQPQPIQIVQRKAHASTRRSTPRSIRHERPRTTSSSASTRTSAWRSSCMGSLARFDRDQYTWKSDSSQLLRAGAAALGQQPVPRRHPVPVLRPPGRPADAALRLRALHQRAGTSS